MQKRPRQQSTKLEFRVRRGAELRVEFGIRWNTFSYRRLNMNANEFPQVLSFIFNAFGNCPEIAHIYRNSGMCVAIANGAAYTQWDRFRFSVMLWGFSSRGSRARTRSARSVGIYGEVSGRDLYSFLCYVLSKIANITKVEQMLLVRACKTRLRGFPLDAENRWITYSQISVYCKH